MPIQQMLLGAGAVATKPYVDDVFSTYLFKANGSTGQTINNGINLSGEGGLVWHKDRDATYNHVMWDTVRGDDVIIRSDTNAANSTVTNGITFNSNGYSVNTAQGNESTNDTVSWTFRKAPGFFDVVTYTGSGSTQQIAHNLQSIPGCYMIKNTSNGGSWMVYHRQLNNGVNAANYRLMLDGTSNAQEDNVFGDTAPTATHFTAGSSHQETNQSGHSYVCYLFAGGESGAAIARSVDFDGSNDYLSIPDSSDFTIGTNYTAECWFYADAITGNGWDGIFGQWSGNNNAATNSWVLESVGNSFVLRFYYINSGGTLAFKSLVDEANGEALALKQWHHFAFVKSGSTTKLYLNGILKHSFDTTYQDGSGSFNIGGNVASGGWFNGKVSNVRIVNGTAVYTSSFRPPTAPLTNITNTKLLCCNDSSQTGSTVTPGTITNNGSTASSDSPFDDPAAFIFGDAEDQNVIKCGSYVGNGNAGGPEINLGWEPQWLLIKNADNASEHWKLFDNMRGMTSGGIDTILEPSTSNQDGTGNDAFDVLPTGFKIKQSVDYSNETNKTIIYIAIRRPDGYVGKPAEAGTDVFAMDVGDGSGTIPSFDSGFPVDWVLTRQPASTQEFHSIARLTGTNYMFTNSNAAEAAYANFTMDSNLGWNKGSEDSSNQSWMWKRHAGFDVVNFDGRNVTGTQIPHQLGKAPEMLWVKCKNDTYDWNVWHKGLNGGTNSEQYYMYLNSTAVETQASSRWNNTLPTSTHVTFGDSSHVNGGSSRVYLMMLFASVDGISKVGYYTGTGNSGLTITTGFQPRFLMFKSTTRASTDWVVFDTTRGLSSGNDPVLKLNSNAAQVTGYDLVDVTSTGFVFGSVASYDFNSANEKYIYYAHA